MFAPGEMSSEGWEQLRKRLLRRATWAMRSLSSSVALPDPSDVVQETILRFLKSNSGLGYDRTRSLYSFLVGVMKNVLTEMLRAGGRSAGSLSDDDFVNKRAADPRFQTNPWPETNWRLATDQSLTRAHLDRDDQVFVEAARRVSGPCLMSEIAEDTGWRYSRVRRHQKRLQRRLKDLRSLKDLR